MKHFIIYLFIIFGLIFLTIQKGYSVDWIRTTLDDGYQHGLTSAIGIDKKACIHIIYRNPNQVKHAFQDTARNWHYEIVTSANLGGFNRHSLDFDSKNQIHISFHHSDTYSFNSLEYAFKDHLGWANPEIIDRGYIYSTTIKIDKNDFPHIVYCIENNTLKYAFKDEIGWHVQIIATNANEETMSHKMFDFDQDGRPCVTYIKFSSNNNDLIFAWLDGTTWKYETVVSNLGHNTLGDYPGISMEIDKNNYVHIVYNMRNDHAVKYVYQDNTGWNIRTIRTVKDYGAYPCIDLDDQNYPHVCYFNEITTNEGYYNYAYKDPGGWHIETASNSSENTYSNRKWGYSAIALNENNEAHICYYGFGLRFARPKDYGPNPFSLISPSDGSDTTPQPAFRWEASSYHGNGLTCYELWIDDVLNKGNIPPYQVTTTVENPLSYGWHNWKVKAFLSGGGEIWSNETWEFEAKDPYDLGFRPNPNGFKFRNHDTNHLRDWNMFKHFFGEKAVINGKNRGAARKYWKKYYNSLTPGGSCVGMSAASLISFFDNDIDQSYVGKYSMPRIDRLFDYNSTPEIERSIAYYHGCQKSLLLSKIPNFKNPNQLFRAIEDSIKLNNPIVFVFKDPIRYPDGAQHAVVPYKTQRSENGQYGNIWVYDCNSNPAGNNDMKFLFSFAHNSWFYEYSKGEFWSGYLDVSETWLFPLKYFTKSGIPPWSQGGSKAEQIDLVAGSGSIHLLFTSEDGSRLGYDQNDQFFDEIEGAYRLFDAGFNQEEQRIEKYVLPSELIYDVTVFGKDIENFNLDIIADGYWLEIKNASISSTTIDHIKFSKDGSLITYSTNDEAKTYSVIFDRELENKSIEFSVSNTTLSNGDSSIFEIINEISLKYVNTGNPKNYDLSLVQVGIDSGSFSFKNITISSNESHIITPHDWEKLDSTNILLEIDRGNDGTIDSSVILNQYVGVESDESSAKITNFSLSQNYPNPFNSETTFKYQLPISCHVEIKIYNTIGQEIRTLIDGEQQAGYHQITWDGKDDSNKKVGTGIYICQLKAEEFVAVKKMIMIE